MGRTLKYAEHKLDEAIRQGEPDETIAYWRGYRDCAKDQEKDHFPDPKKMVPLTIEQLREMDGWPVWVEVLDLRFNEENQWAICNAEYQMMTLKDGFKLFFCGYESNWLAYAYPPAHIDREAWKPCGACKDGGITIHVPKFRAMAVCNQHMDHEAFDVTFRLKFCPWCGRPLTEEAWADLEKRLRG